MLCEALLEFPNRLIGRRVQGEYVGLRLILAAKVKQGDVNCEARAGVPIHRAVGLDVCHRLHR